MALKATELNFVYHVYDIDFGDEEYSYLEVQKFFQKDSIISKKGIIKRLELGFAPAVSISNKFEESCRIGRGDW